MTLALHASRSAAPASELQAIESIVKADGSGDEAVTVKEIAAQTGISVQTVRRRLRLRSLTAGLRAAFDEGRITAGVAEKAARLSDEQQARLEQQVDEGGRLTLADVRDVARTETSAAAAACPTGCSPIATSAADDRARTPHSRAGRSARTGAPRVGQDCRGARGARRRGRVGVQDVARCTSIDRAR